MKKSKLNLTALKVQSFVTDLELEKENTNNIKGGASIEALGACVNTKTTTTLLPDCMVGFSMGARICTRDSC